MLDHTKYLKPYEVKHLLKIHREKAELAEIKGIRTPVVRYNLVFLYLATGLRLTEARMLKLEDIHLHKRDELSWLDIWHAKRGKGKCQRVIVSDGLKIQLRKFLRWKIDNKEPMTPDSYLFISTREHSRPISHSGIQKSIATAYQEAGLSSRYGVHSLRHSHATLLMAASKGNLRVCQESLRHQRISSTAIYAGVTPEELNKSLDQLVSGLGI